MSAERPCGYVLDRADDPSRVGEDVLLGASELAGFIPPSTAIQQPLWITEQRGPSCTGHYWAEAIYGMTGEKQSPYLPFYFGLMHDYGGNEGAIEVASGVSMASTLAAVREHGSCLWKFWNPSSFGFTPTGRPPALGRVDAQKRNVDAIRIYSVGGDSAVESVCAAIAAGRPPGIVVRVDDAFDNPNPVDGYVGPQTGRHERGLHIITGWSYRTLQNGERRVSALVHWGPRFGLNGLVELDPDRIRRAPFLCYPRSLA